MKSNISYEQQTQDFSTFGDKLLQHTDTLFSIQQNRVFKPITIQLAPTESCDSNCSFCSVAGRDITQKIPFEKIKKGLQEFKVLGAKALEITGGGNPLLYRDGEYTIEDVICFAYSIGYKIGVITNSANLSKYISPACAEYISWVRISLIKLDEGLGIEDYNFNPLPEVKIGLSYIIYEKTTSDTIKKIAQLVEMHPSIKFVRVAADCLTEDSLKIKEDWGDIIETLDNYKKFFIKEINDNFHPYSQGCWVGMIRPYWVWNGVYICTSHVLKHRNYDETFKLCDCDNILTTWNAMNGRFAAGGNPYDIDISKECWHCYYYSNNKILSSVIREMPDKEFV